MQLEQVIAPLTRAQFLAEHYGRSFAVMRGARGRFSGLLTWEELNAILEQHRLAPPRLKLVQDGRQLEPSRYLAAGLGGAPRLDSGKFASCLAGGATLVLDAVEELAPRVRATAEMLREAFGAGTYVNLYAGWFDQNGFDLHWDSQDTLMLQLSGRKRWRIFGATRTHPLQDDIEAPAAPSGTPIWDGVLEDGDALYIPRGWWHLVHPLGEPSLHLTFSTVQPTGYDLLRHLAGRLRAHPEVRMDLPPEGDAAGQAAYLARLRELAAAMIEDGAAEQFRRQWRADSFPSARVRLPEAPYLQLAAPSEESRIRLASSHALQLTCEGESVAFVAGGVSYALPADFAPVLAALSDTRSVPLAELAALLAPARDAQDLRQAIGALARAGVLLVE